MSKRTPYPPVFWVANMIEVLERFAYYGIYFGFGIYMEHLGYSRGQLGIIQSIFLAISYFIPVISGQVPLQVGQTTQPSPRRSLRCTTPRQLGRGQRPRLRRR